MPWRVRKSDVDYFHQVLWKDLRPFPKVENPEHFAKDCFTSELATIEASAMLLLGERIGHEAVPRAVAIEGSALIMERVVGARLFDLIRHLRAIAIEGPDARATEVLNILMDRSLNRLRVVQLELLRLAPFFSHHSYPLEEKLTGLLDLFIRIMEIRPVSSRWRTDIEELVNYWENECVVVPFRDATTKNMIVADRRIGLQPVDDWDAEQRQAVRHLLASEPIEYWDRVPIVDIDFSSIVHLTSVEDDPISLQCHQWTLGLRPFDAASLVLDPALGQPDPDRAAAAMLVRYLRFGGRKLAYRIINSQGFKVRFAFDEPSFYFERVSGLCHDLSPKFASDYVGLLTVVQQYATAWRNAKKSDMEHLAVDHLRKHYPVQGLYWQQNPGEYFAL